MLLEKGIRIVVNEQVKIYSERIDDIPVIVEWLKKMEIAKWIDQKLSPPHGNHEGMSYGQLSVLLLTYVQHPVRPSVVCCGTLGRSTPKDFRVKYGVVEREKRCQ
jgi:hypothetical protein